MGDAYNAIIDGGQGRISPKLIYPSIPINKYLISSAINKLNLAIATHNDSDHTNGLIRILKDDRIHVDELWLPALWLDRLKDLANDPTDFFDEMIYELLSRDELESESFEAWLNEDKSFELNDSKEEMNENDAIDRIISESSFDDEFKIREAFVEACSEYFPFHTPHFGIYLNKANYTQNSIRSMGGPTNRYKIFDLTELFNGAINIYKLVKAAKGKSKIRWFKFNSEDLQQNLSSVNFSPILPVNSRYVTRVKTRKLSALKYLTLSMNNRKSLVFHHIKIDGAAPILLSADSDLNFEIPMPDKMIVTAPHHGLESANAAYTKISNLNDPILVRNSSNASLKQPGKTFINSACIKYCDECYPAGNVQEVVLEWKGGKWIAPQATQKCTCF